MKIARALISLSDKTGLLPFARALSEEMGVEILSTGGTATTLRDAGIPVRDVSDFTGFPEIFTGRVKTLHPRVHGGLLHLRDDAGHQRQARENGIQPIDLLVVNLYPFRETVARPDVTLEEAIENIDIGGPSMLRSAAKNHRFVTVVTDPADYDGVLASMRGNDGDTTLKLREELALKVFQATTAYDAAIAAYLGRRAGAETGAGYELSLPLVSRLRYGENAHQEASLYGDFEKYFEQLHGKELSYNNILDISAAAQLIGEYEDATVAILKHTNPCGVGSDPDLREAWDKAFATDKQAPFGGIIICNRPLTEALARDVSEIFSEVIIAPDFEWDARALLQRKKNLRLIRQLQPADAGGAVRDARSVVGRRAGAGPRPCVARRGWRQRRHQTATDGSGAQSSHVRLAGGQARQEQRHRVHGRGPHTGGGRGADVARGFGAHRGLESEGRGPEPDGQRRGERRVFPVPRRPDRRRRRGCDRRHPARR